jgi:PAS domain S-box-containing protein
MTEAAHRPRVLAVDDTPANLTVLEAVLGSRYELILAHSGAEALAQLERNPNIDVILLDVQMPNMDGYQTAEQIKKLPACSEIPLIFITAIYTEDPQIKRGYAVGAVDYFTKPFDPEILRLKVDVYSTFRRRDALLKERERQLHESEALLHVGRRLAAVLEGLPVGVAIADAEGRICQTNETCLRILKSARAVHRGAYGEVVAWWERNAEAFKQEGSALALALEQGESSHNILLEVPFLDGTTKHLLESTSPLKAHDGAIVGAVIVVQDVTEHKRVEVDLEQRIARLVSAGIETQRRSAPGPR